MDMAWWIVFVVAIARVTGLITTDELTRPAREWFIGRLNQANTFQRWVAYMAECSWCASIWVSLFTVPVMYWHGTQWWVQVPALVLAASQVVGMTHNIGRG